MADVKKVATRDSYGKALMALAQEHDNIIVFDADLGGSTKSAMIKKVNPNLHINAGIAELARRGFLEVRPRQGTFVADYRRDGNMDTLMAIMEYNGGMLGKEEIRSILEVRWGL